jgi:hypothetical protein
MELWFGNPKRFVHAMQIKWNAWLAAQFWTPTHLLFMLSLQSYCYSYVSYVYLRAITNRHAVCIYGVEFTIYKIHPTCSTRYYKAIAVEFNFLFLIHLPHWLFGNCVQTVIAPPILMCLLLSCLCKQNWRSVTWLDHGQSGLYVWPLVLATISKSDYT